MAKAKAEFWTLYLDGQLCSKHRSLAAAERAARACERQGGNEHSIYKVIPCARPPYKRRKPADKRR